MTAFSTYSTTPSVNVTVGGVSVAENCAAGNVNNAIRQICAEGRELYNLVDAIDTADLLPKAGGTVTGNITRSGMGPHLYHANSALASGGVYIQATGSTRPTAAEGRIVFYY